MLDQLTQVFVPVHREGHRYVAAAAVATVILFLLSTSAGWVAALMTAWIACYFRDPDRVTPLRSGLVVAPADGRLAAIEIVPPPAELGLGSDPRTRLEIELSLFDVHVNRAPVAGVLRRSLHLPGGFGIGAAGKPGDSHERRAMVIGGDNGEEFTVVQFASLLARGTVAFVPDGAFVGVGERIGMLRLGNRVDLWLPPGCNALVAAGQRMVAGETVVADKQSAETGREARRI